MTESTGRLLPSGTDVKFSEIESGQAAQWLDAGKCGPLALTATIVVVGPLERLVEAAEALEGLTDIGVRAILISYGTNAVPPVRVAQHAVALEGLRQEYLNNAVGALRLSSLPTLVWWRGGAAAESLDGLGDLADRLVLDAEDPSDVWRRVGTLAERVAVSDLRWTRLTRWRALMAHFFDIPEVRDEAQGFHRLQIEGSDLHCARLFAGWLASSLKWDRPPDIDVRAKPGAPPVARVELGGDAETLTLSLASSGTCVEAAVRLRGQVGASRIVSLGEQGLAALVGEELRIRSRDLAFERAVAAAEGVV
jgi:glucose-6-phosphate dehydrogenase assembly protein OpcA